MLFSHLQCSGKLLTMLWDTLSYHDTMGDAGRGMVSSSLLPAATLRKLPAVSYHLQVKLLFPLWMMTVRPYMAMLEHWMMNGALTDKHSEFCLQRYTGVCFSLLVCI